MSICLLISDDILFHVAIVTCTSKVCSSVLGSNFDWNFSGSFISPLALAHVTVGLGSPITFALKMASFPILI